MPELDIFPDAMGNQSDIKKVAPSSGLGGGGRYSAPYRGSSLVGGLPQRRLTVSSVELHNQLLEQESDAFTREKEEERNLESDRKAIAN